MNNLNTKKRIILTIIVSIIIAGIGYYAYAKDKNDLIQQDKNLELETNKQEQQLSQNDIDSEEKNNKIIVHVSGAVVNEGIVELESNSRISDAINKAGGLKENANIEDINLAYILEDGMKIHVPTKGENDKNKLESQDENEYETSEQYITKSNGINVEKGENNTVSNNKNSKININKATQVQLETLPGIGTSTALKIINYRKENGNFKSIEDIKNVNGIGESKFNNIKDLITT